MPPHEEQIILNEFEAVDDSKIDLTVSLQYTKNITTEDKTIYSKEELLYYAKCFSVTEPKQNILDTIYSIPSVVVRYGILFPLRLTTLTASTIAFFSSLPIALALDSKPMVSTLIKYYCKGILFSLGVLPNYQGKKPLLKEPHVFVANHTSYLDYIVLSAHQYPGAVVMAKHNGVLGFLQNNGLNYLNSMTFDRSNTHDRKYLSQKLKEHVMNPQTFSNPIIIFPEGTCVNNKYIIRFQKGAFELGVKVCPVGIKYDSYWGSPYWDTRKGFIHYAIFRMTRWCTPINVVYCPTQTIQQNENTVSFSHRVKSVISTSIGLQIEDFNGRAKKELLQILTMQ
ncbi:acyltransferase-domain-containing protein [Cunninghamella echinulata]|nr:acyltransferase-domain-containing protein [Cunninghamella echinulata]